MPRPTPPAVKPANQSTEAKPLIVRDRYGKAMLTVEPEQVSSYQSLVDDWQTCDRCPLHATRQNVVFARGNLPAEVLFIGEAPGQVEDDFGFPFVGPSGRLLATILKQIRQHNNGWRYAITNPVGCIPWENDEGKIRQPHTGELAACLPRLLRIVELCQPQGIVLLGKVAENSYATYSPGIEKVLGYKPKSLGVYHPAYILRQGGANGNVAFDNTLSGLKRFIFSTLMLGR
jgi:uracil-DNA glycosylase family 4